MSFNSRMDKYSSNIPTVNTIQQQNEWNSYMDEYHKQCLVKKSLAQRNALLFHSIIPFVHISENK